jgi:DegV family protein with EDD domain
VVAIHLSSALSGTYQSAVLAARKTPGVYTVDSQSATIGSALLVRIAVELRDRGLGAAEIAGRLAALSERVRLFAYIPTLKYLVRGGRLSATAGMVGSRLNIYPLLSVQDGALKNEGKARGKNAACREIARLMKAEGIDKEYGVVFGHAAAPDDIAGLKDALGDLLGDCESYNCVIGAVVGVHSGPGAVGVAFIKAR